ncbi:MAG: sodium pump decarboxylase subunit gamma [Candidatus Thioglobus sp.]|nr:sodium pump decarboxylase subunit gamma [Candidatus Thioglobus sp.]
MQTTQLLAQAIELTLFGMGFVFLFLTLLVFVTKLMSVSIRVISAGKGSSADGEIDEEAKFVIQQAIKLHREA